MKVITILMSTYNGERYLERQLKSISEQKGMDMYAIKLICRDDGSSDNTLSILKSWSDSLSISIIEGDNIGARDSFFYLLDNAPESDYYAFCDQDDVWNEDKLIRAISSINDEYDLYFSNIEYLDSTGRELKRNLLQEDFYLDLQRVLMCNPANGCAMVWGRRIQNLLKQVPTDTFTMHDEFVCTIAVLLGKVIYDPIPSMGYRLHELNVTQSNSLRKKLKLWRSIWFGRKAYSLDKRASVLLKYAKNKDDKLVLSKLSQYKKGLNRFKLLNEYACENSDIQRSFKLRMLMGLL